MIFFIQESIKEKSHLINGIQVIFGVGKITIKKLLKINGLLFNTKGNNLRKKHKESIKLDFDEYPKPLARELKQIYKKNCQRLVDNRCYRGIRHKLGYPVRGQRTRTNGSIQKKLHERWIGVLYKKAEISPVKKKVFLKKKIVKKVAPKTKVKFKPKSKAKASPKPSKYKV